MKPFEDRNAQLIKAWNELVDSMRKWGKAEQSQKHKPNPEAYGICEHCRNYFDNEVKQ